jgi:iron complex transport system substrate-binding protein
MDNNKIIKFKFSKFTGMAIFLASILILLSGPVLSAQDTGQDTSLNTRQIMDYSGRTVNIPAIVDRIICSGPGALRLVTYLNAQNLVVGVDDIEKRTRLFDARPYAFANPHFKKLPVFGGFRGHDSPEKILGLDPLPQVILKTFATMGYDPAKLEKKTDIPVITLEYGDLLHNRKQFYASLTILGQVLARENPEVLFLDLSTLQMGDEQ